MNDLIMQAEKRSIENGRRKEDARIIEITTKLAKLDAEHIDTVALIRSAVEKTDAISKQLEIISKQNETQLEIMEAWNNAKGFVNTMKTLGRLMKWLAGIAAAGAAIWTLLNYKIGGGS